MFTNPPGKIASLQSVGTAVTKRAAELISGKAKFLKAVGEDVLPPGSVAPAAILVDPTARAERTEMVLVEDSDADADLIMRALRKENLANPLRQFADALSAWNYLSVVFGQSDEERFPAVLMIDLKLPGISGLELLKGLLATHRQQLGGTLKIVISGSEDLEAMREAYATGAQTFLGKPVDRHEIRELIANYPEYWIIDPRLAST